MLRSRPLSSGSPTAMRRPDQDHEAIARLSATLPLRQDADRVRSLLAEAFISHAGDLWPAGRGQGTPEWIAAHTDVVLATIERLYAVAVDGNHPGSDEFLERLMWLPELIRRLEANTAPFDA